MTVTVNDLPRLLMFVCSGNTCRSPMAEGFMNSFLEKEGSEPLWKACSAGILPSRGIPANEFAVKVMSEYGVDISRHRSTSLTDWELPEGTLFLGMTLWHKEELTRAFPERASSIFLLGEAAGFQDRGTPVEVPDPFGFSIASYRNIAGHVRDMTLALASSLGRDLRFVL